MFRTEHQWREVSTQLQLSEIPPENIARILYECISDLLEENNKLGVITSSIVQLSVRTSEIMGDNRGPLNGR